MTLSVDIKKDILDRLGDLSKFDLFANRILVAIYIRPEKTSGGIFLTDQNRDEDRYQGKVGLVIKAGPSAFADPDLEWFGGNPPKAGDWVGFRVSDGVPTRVNKVECRIIDDTRIMCKIAHPDQLW